MAAVADNSRLVHQARIAVILVISFEHLSVIYLFLSVNGEIRKGIKENSHITHV